MAVHNGFDEAGAIIGRIYRACLGRSSPFKGAAGRIFAIFLSVLWVVQISLPSSADAQGRRLPLIRDAEIETLMRDYTSDMFRVAGLTQGAVRVHLINSKSINAFVAGGQRMFIHTGLLTSADSPNEVMGVLAHETGHITGAHLARAGIAVDKLSNLTILTALLGAAAVGAAAAGGASGVGAGAGGVLAGSQALPQQQFLAYSRAIESSADQAAIKYMDKMGMSGKGMLDLFKKLANQSRARLNNVPPYLLTHPLAQSRINILERRIKSSPHYYKRDPDELMLRHRLMQAKLHGFLDSPRKVTSIYGRNPKSLEGRYARAIMLYRRGEMKRAIPMMDGLIKVFPNNPYFHELKGQALLESGSPKQALAPLRKAVKLAPRSGLIRILTAEALINAEPKRHANEALRHLAIAKQTENGEIKLHRLRARAYAAKNQIALAELATAEAAVLRGDREVAVSRARGALKRGLKKGSPQFQRAHDIIGFTPKRRKR